MIHFFDSEIAQEYGVNAAVILQHIAFWVEKNEANNRNFHDGYYWTYNSIAAMQKLFPYLSKNQITTAIDKLIKAEVIISGNYNEMRYDRTLWYALTEKGKELILKGQVEKIRNALSKNQKCIDEKSEMESQEIRNGLSKNQKPIPDNKPYNITDIITDNKKNKGNKTEIDALLENYTQNNEIITAMQEFLKMRKAMKKPATTRAVQLLLNTLDKLGDTDSEKLNIINQSIERGWQGFFEIKEDKPGEKKKELSQEDLEFLKAWGGGG